MFCPLTVVDEADRGARVNAGNHFSSFNLFKTVRQTTEEVLPLLAEAKPQIELQLSLHCPAGRAEALLPRQLRTQFTTAGGLSHCEEFDSTDGINKAQEPYAGSVAIWPNP